METRACTSENSQPNRVRPVGQFGNNYNEIGNIEAGMPSKLFNDETDELRERPLFRVAVKYAAMA